MAFSSLSKERDIEAKKEGKKRMKKEEVEGEKKNTYYPAETTPIFCMTFLEANLANSFLPVPLLTLMWP